jgi:DsbC/DsbD-like thiol-disulfide interchange protein
MDEAMKTKPGLFSIILWLAWFLALAIPPAHGAATVSTPHATVTLLSEQPQATPGQTLWLGLRFELIPHWHVYWRNPGASGTAPVIRWTLPEAWTAGDLHWPVPQRIRVGPLTNYGYEEAVTLLAPVRVPAGPLPAGPLTLTADAEWLVCRVECIPESGRLTLELPHPGSLTGDPATQRLFAAARAQWPEADRVTGRYRLAGDARTITLEVPGLAVDDRAEVWFAAYEWGAGGPQRRAKPANHRRRSGAARTRRRSAPRR